MFKHVKVTNGKTINSKFQIPQVFLFNITLTGAIFALL